MKMNVSMSMDFFKPVKQFFKKYTALLPSIAITAAALLILPFLLMMGGAVKKEMNTSINLANRMKTLLGDVPSKDTPQQIKLYMDRLEEEATQIETLAVETSLRELISYDVFPPKSTSSQLYVTFGRKYRTAVEQMVESMDALDAPSEAEIRSQTGATTRTAGRMEGGRRQTGRNVETDPMLDALCRTRAQEISVYAHPSVFPWYDFWESYDFVGEQQALMDCWYSQVVYWISRDIADTISAMNDGSEKVSSSPVKRLMAISFSEPITPATAGAGRMYQDFALGIRDIPYYVLPAQTTPLQESVTAAGVSSVFVPASLTMRAGDEEVDVIHFAFSVLVDNRYVMAFKQELCSEKKHTWREGFQEDGQEKTGVHNQITILDTCISAVDKLDAEHDLYRYGNGAVMRMDFVCEYQFDRKGHDPIKPEPIKQILGQSETEGQIPASPMTPSRRRMDPGRRGGTP